MLEDGKIIESGDHASLTALGGNMRSLLNNSRLILWMLKQPHNFYYEKRKIMKPIIVDLKDISDSTEVYDSKPNRFVPYTIYIICAILTIALIWMYLFRMDIVVKADSVFRGDDDSTAVSCAVTGKITKMSVKDGQYVSEGDELYEIDIETLEVLSKIIRVNLIVYSSVLTY